MIANKMEKRFSLGKILRAPNSMPISEWFFLVHKRQMSGMVSSNRPKRIFIVGMNDNANIFDSCPNDFFDNYAENRFLLTISVDECLER
jgi:hypothetical protein